MTKPIPFAEWRALVAQGPAIVMMARERCRADAPLLAMEGTAA